MEESIFERARAAITRSFIEREFGAPGAHWNGDRYLTLNPTRDDKTIKSFSVKSDGTWYEFADGSHGDVFDLIAARDGTDATQEALKVLGMSGARPAPAGRKRKAAPKAPEPIRPDWKPIPAGISPEFSVPPDDLTLYYDMEGRPMFYVVRYDTPDGKEIFPIYFTGSGFEKGLPPNLDYRPLAQILKNGKTVVVVEGEKKRREAQERFPGYNFTCWHGGARVAGKVALEPLRGCDVILWPDNDQVGTDAMNNIALRLCGVAERIRIVNIPYGVSKGWDIANAMQEGRDIEFFLQTAREFKPSPEELATELWQELKPRPFTDLGNAERFVDRWHDDMRYNVDKMKWVFWDKRVWNDEDQSLISNKIKKTIRGIADLDRKGSRVWAHKCESASRIASMLSLASREPGIPVHEYGFDPDPFAFNCPNGIVNLKTGELSPHSKEALCSKIGSVEYKNEPHPVFDKFLEDITVGRKDYIEFLQRWFGYSLTADVSAQSFAIFYGNGANGKSTLVELMTRIAGAYAKTAAPDTFIQKIAGSGIPNDIAALRGARLVLASETEANARLAESKIKAMTGGDTVVARFMRAEFFEFQPTWKIVISTNHRPKVSGADYGIWRRIILVPFNFIASGPKLDPQMPAKLWAERVGIFSWMVEGAVKWYQSGMGRVGLGISDELIHETQDYREDEDIIGRFISDACYTEATHPLKLAARNIQVQASELFRYFINWAADGGESYAAKMTQTAFGRAMRERGFDGVRDKDGHKKYIGIQIRRDQ